jgi:arsenate reductase
MHYERLQGTTKMSEVTIYHNPRCSKSRQTLELLKEKSIEPEVVEYLKTPPNAAELKDILSKLGLSADELMRKKEAIYKELGLAGVSDENELITAMVNNPKLIERPIVIKGDKAAIGRPPESVLDIL